MLLKGQSMAQLLDHIEYLSREIGPRPAGTEEEQESALYIADQFQQESGFRAEIEEFTSSANLEGARAIPAVLIIVVVILAMLFNVLTIPALVITLVAVAIYASESFDHPYLSKALARGASQNVVAKYQLGKENQAQGKGSRSRKVVLVAHYDTGKVKPGLIRFFESLGLPLGYIALGGMVATILLLCVRIFVGSGGGVATIVLNVLAGIALLAVALPVVKAVLTRISPYNEGANNNASGVAALIEIARRISEGSASEADLALSPEQVVMHGEQEARESGLVPENAELVYEPTQTQAFVEEDEFGNYTEEERLVAAKAAIAALTGRPVESYVSISDSATTHAKARIQPEEPASAVLQDGENSAVELQPETVIQSAQPDSSKATVVSSQVIQPVAIPASGAVAQQAGMVHRTESAEVGGFQNAPSWFIAAQKNAKRPSSEASQAQRSRYTQALETAERDAANRERQREEEELQRQAIEQIRREEAVRSSQEAAQPAEPEPVQNIDRGGVPQNVVPAELPSISDERADQEPLRTAVPAVVSVPDVQEDVSAEPVTANNQAEQKTDLGKTVAHKPISIQELQEFVGDDMREEPEGPKKQSPLSSLPEIGESQTEENAEEQEALVENANPSRSGMFRKLRADIPSLSGVIRMQEEGVEPSAASIQANEIPEMQIASSQPPAKETAVRPAPPSLSNEAAPVDYDMEVPDLYDMDPAIDEPVGLHSGNNAAAPAPGQVEMPASRADGFLGRLRKNKDENLGETPQEWLDVDKDFDARTVGRERGGWESFRDDQASGNQTGDSANKGESGRWEGGGFSRVHLDYVDTRSTEESETELPPELADAAVDKALNEEIGQIIHFRNPQYNTEIWFVAIGSDTELHDGAKAFVNEHRSELRGAMIIELESLGAGVLACASEEGQFRKVKASSRVRRFTRPATEATGIDPEDVSLAGADSITSTIQKAGFQAMHLFGMENGRQSLKGSADDVIENIDELTLEENISFLMELLKNA